jgi:hypothetical protein
MEATKAEADHPTAGGNAIDGLAVFRAGEFACTKKIGGSTEWNNGF